MRMPLRPPPSHLRTCTRTRTSCVRFLSKAAARVRLTDKLAAASLKRPDPEVLAKQIREIRGAKRRRVV